MTTANDNLKSAGFFGPPQHVVSDAGVASPVLAEKLSSSVPSVVKSTVLNRYQRRPYQRAVLRALKQQRCFILLWRRQGGKSTTLAEAAHYEMMQTPGRLVTYASASLLLGREIILKEASIFQRAIEHLSALAREAQRLEFRLYHSRSVFSRTQVIAPNPATARGWTGTVLLDEFGFIKDFRDLWEAVEPIVSTDPDFHLILATTPPKDDAHYSYELTAPPVGTEFAVSAEGNWYHSQAGKLVHRVDIFDAHAAGVKLFDLDSGRELSPEEHFRRADDKDAWRRNYKVEHVLGGTSACGLIQLDTAQRRGVGQCACIFIDTESDFDQALQFLRQHLGSGIIGLGWDVATTEKESSNPSALAVAEQIGVEVIVRLIIVWKTRHPDIARDRIRQIIAAIRSRSYGGPARQLCIDATNERYFATDMRRDLGAEMPVTLIVGSETIDRPGQEEPMSMKQFLGNQLVAELDDNHLTLPPERYVREDFRLVKRDRGTFACVPAPDGKHGDTFDAVKLALHALKSGSNSTPPKAFDRGNARTALKRERAVLA